MTAPPKRGPGRPPKPKGPRTAQQARLAVAVEKAENALELAADAYQGARSVANEVALLSCELSVSSAWAAYLRASGDFTNATRCSADSAKTAANLCRLRELVALDHLEQIENARTKAAGALGKKKR